MAFLHVINGHVPFHNTEYLYHSTGFGCARKNCFHFIIKINLSNQNFCEVAREKTIPFLVD